MAIVDHHNSHGNLAWRPIPQPWHTGPTGGGGGGKAGGVLRKRTRGRYGKGISRTAQKTGNRAHAACTAPRFVFPSGKLVLSNNGPYVKGHSVIPTYQHHQNSVGTCCVQRAAR